MTNIPSSEAPFLSTSMYLSDEAKEIRTQLEENYRNTSNCVNAREIALYDLTEVQTGQQWFTSGDVTKKRYGYRKCFLATTAGAVTNITHSISDIAGCRVTALYGTMQNSPFTLAIPLPQSNPNPVYLTIGPVNITINDTGAAFVGYIAYVVVEYVRDN